MKFRYLLIILSVLLALVAGGMLYLRNQVYFSKGSAAGSVIFEVEKGQGAKEIGAGLEKKGLIAGKYYLYYYLKTRDLSGRLLPGIYQLEGGMTIPEIVAALTDKKAEFVKITFPEGWGVREMTARLEANGLPGKDFEQVARKPSEELQSEFGFLGGLPAGAPLEGFLFPDTYFFSKEATGEGIARKMLDNFGRKITDELQNRISTDKKSLFEVVTLASIIEGEVRSDEDRRIVSGLFWDRIGVGQALQSCATLAYVLGENKKQYSYEDTRTPSAYNTYLHPGLPPGPISNPGLSAILAAIYPTETDYNYFLSDPETGETIFSKTIDEHNANKAKYGL